MGDRDLAKQVLIVEDEKNIAEALSFLLEREGYAVTHVADGESGLAQMRLERPDAVLLDVMLPGRSGFEVLRAIRTDPALSETPVAMLTARGQAHDRQRAEAGGADVYMTKPFANREVVAQIRSLIE